MLPVYTELLIIITVNIYPKAIPVIIILNNNKTNINKLSKINVSCNLIVLYKSQYVPVCKSLVNV